MKEAETMAYRFLLGEDGSDSGTEQVPPPTGGHLTHAIKCGEVTPTSLDPKTRAAVWADITSPAPNKEWEAEFNWQLAAQASVAGFMGTPPAYPWKPERRHQWSQGLRPRLHLLGMAGAD